MASCELLTSPSPERFRDRTLERLVKHVRELAAVDAVMIVTVDPERTTVERSAGWFGAETLQSRVDTLGGGPLGRRGRGLIEAVLERDRPLLLARLDAWEPDLLAVAVRTLGPRRARALWSSYRGASVAACPLRSEDGQALGVLAVASLDRGRLQPSVLEVVGELSAMALDSEGQRRITRALTVGFVPESLPELSGYDSGLLYAPALGDPAGGDVFGAWRRPSGDVAMLVGDVAGKGVETAALSSMVRFFVEARSWDHDSPAAVLEQTNAMLLERLPEYTFVTAFLAILSSDRMRYCNAGHLPPLRLSRAGVQEVGGHGVPLGVRSVPDYVERGLRLEHGDLVFAYTDGLTEARRKDETFGTERLARLVHDAARTEAPEQLVRHVHEEIVRWSGGLSDDAMALALRRGGAPSARSA
jgi:hypothetical protein